MPIAEDMRMVRSRVRSTDRSDGPAGTLSTTMTSRCGWTRNARAHSTSVEECTSISGSTTTVHLDRSYGVTPPVHLIADPEPTFVGMDTRAFAPPHALVAQAGLRRTEGASAAQAGQARA